MQIFDRDFLSGRDTGSLNVREGYLFETRISSTESEQLARDKQKVPIEVFINLRSSTYIIRMI